MRMPVGQASARSAGQKWRTDARAGGARAPRVGAGAVRGRGAPATVRSPPDFVAAFGPCEEGGRTGVLRCGHAGLPGAPRHKPSGYAPAPADVPAHPPTPADTAPTHTP